MMHVAEAGEAKGRVVLQLCSATPHPVALEAALWLARAFQSEIEGLFVEDQQLLELTNFPFVREISLSGKTRRSVSSHEIERHFRISSADFHRRLERLATAAEIPFRGRVVRDDPLHALAAACAEKGPWNVVALAEPYSSTACPGIQALFDQVADTTGLLLVGPNARRVTGRIVVVLECTDDLSSMIGTADRLSKVTAAATTICLMETSQDSLLDLEAATRLAIGDQPDLAIVSLDLSRSSAASTGEILRRLGPGLIIGHFGGLFVPSDDDFKPMLEVLECPLLLVR